MDRPHALLILALGCAPQPADDTAAPVDTGTASPPPWADEVLSAPGHTGFGTRDVARAINGARGGGRYQGSFDVFSLGLQVGVDDELILRWSGRRLVDGPGPDLAVFENAFEVQGGGWFVDPTIVEVTADGERWVAFPHDYLADDERAWDPDPALWPGFAGLTPVHLHEEDHPVDPFDEAAGGDVFDLADLPGEEGETIRALGVLAVRLTSAAARVNPDTGEPWPREPVSDGADIDAVYGRAFVEAD